MQLGWVDFSKGDRDKVMSVINLLQERGAVDELGIGLIRDAFSNYFFPGTSTVQTRAKYFLIVPYVLQEAVTGQYGNQVSEILRAIDKNERDCALSLYRRYEDDPIKERIIGARILPHRWVARKPSDIYWNGIRTYRIFTQSAMPIADMVKLSVYLRTQQAGRMMGNRSDQDKEGERDDHDAGGVESLRFFDLPAGGYKDWRRDLDINLTHEEALFLKDKIETSVPDTLLSWMLRNHVDLEQYGSFEALTAAIENDVPPELCYMMRLACKFNRLAYAVHTRYNVILSKGENRIACEEWAAIAERMDHVTEVDIDELMEALRLNGSQNARKLKNFLIALKSAFLYGDEQLADEIIINREINLKTRSRAKLCHAEDYPPDTWVGGRYLDYRFLPAKQIILDIFDGERAANVPN